MRKTFEMICLTGAIKALIPSPGHVWGVEFALALAGASLIMWVMYAAKAWKTPQHHARQD